MTEGFDQIVTEMPDLLDRLLETELLQRDNLGNIPQRGVYVLYEDDKPIYVGRSNRLRHRLLEHSRQSSPQNSAPFAFNLAKEEAARRQMNTSQTRSQLERDPAFKDLVPEAWRNKQEVEYDQERNDSNKC